MLSVDFQAEETTKTEKTSVTRHHQTETASAKSTTTQKQATYRPIHLDNIPLPSTGGKVVGKCVDGVATHHKNFIKVASRSIIFTSKHIFRFQILPTLHIFFGAAVAKRCLTVIFLPYKFCLDVSLDLSVRSRESCLRINI